VDTLYEANSIPGRVVISLSISKPTQQHVKSNLVSSQFYAYI